MRIKLYLLDTFDTSFNEKDYHIYQFVDQQSLTIITYSTTENGKLLELGKTYDCVVRIKKSKLYVEEVLI